MTKLEKDLQDLKRQLADLSDKISDLSQDSAEEVRKSTRDRMGDMEEHIRGLASLLRDHGDVASKRAKEAGRKAVDYTKENPWTVVGIAAAVGLILGLTMRGHGDDEYDEWEDQ